MSAIAVGAAATGAFISSTISGNASRDAAQIQADAANQSAALQKQVYEEQKAGQEPFRQAGLTGQNQLMAYLGLGGDTGAAGYGQWASPSMTAQQFNQYQDPGYAFRLNEGLKALGNSAAARGGLLSGNAMKGITAYGQGLASEEYQNAFNRYQTSRAAALSPLQQLQGVGQAAASNQASAAGQYGTGVSNALTGAANASSAAKIAGANATVAGIGNALGAYARMNTSSSYGSPSSSNTFMPTTSAGQPWQTWSTPGELDIIDPYA